jgi:hypothetical protein
MNELARRWPGRAPWDEVWFLEIAAGPESSIWLRYTLGDGPHRRGLATWAIAFDGDRMAASQGHYRLSSILPNTVLDAGNLHLSATAARGQAEDATWDLALRIGPRAHRMVPRLLERLGIGRTYVPAGLDLFVTGEVQIGQSRWQLNEAPAVLGHIWGATNRTQSWAWCHAHFADGDVLFEGLSAVLGPLKPLTSIGVWIAGRHIDLSGGLQLARTRSETSQTEWTFDARSGGVRVEGVARLPTASRTAIVRYVDPADGATRQCKNSGLSTLDLRIHENGQVHSFTTGHAAFELASRGEPTGPIALSD